MRMMMRSLSFVHGGGLLLQDLVNGKQRSDASAVPVLNPEGFAGVLARTRGL